MGSVNKATLIGNVGRDAELTTTSGGTVAKFSLATTEKFKDREGNRKEETYWHTVVLWGKTAETLAAYLTKGKQVYIEGRIEPREWTNKDGVKQRATDIRADKVVLLGNTQHDRQATPPDRVAEAPTDDDIPF